MEIEKYIMDLFAMTIAVDGDISESELQEVSLVLDEIKYDFTPESRLHFSQYTDQDIPVLKEKFEIAVNELNALDIDDKKYILKYLLRLVDADNIMHDNEVKLIATIMDIWGIK